MRGLASFIVTTRDQGGLEGKNGLDARAAQGRDRHIEEDLDALAAFARGGPIPRRHAPVRCLHYRSESNPSSLDGTLTGTSEFGPRRIRVGIGQRVASGIGFG